MTKDEFKNLDRGNIVRHKAGSDGYVVTSNYGGRVTAVRSVDMTNPCEWDLIKGPDRAALGREHTSGT